jgi:hypothetical protein
MIAITLAIGIMITTLVTRNKFQLKI